MKIHPKDHGVMFGLVALLFAVSIVQTGGILDISNKVKDTQRAQLTSIKENKKYTSLYFTPTLRRGSQELDTNGNGKSISYQWTVPAGITLLKQVSVTSAAGGGGGGGSGEKAYNQDPFLVLGGGGGGGGGGSGYKHTFYDVPVTPGQILCLVVGKGGEGGVGVSAYRNRSYNSTVLGVTSPDGDQLKAYPGQNGGDSYIAESDCNTVLSHNSLNLHVKGGGGGQGGYSKAPASHLATRGALGGEGGWAGYLVSNQSFKGSKGLSGSFGNTTQSGGGGGGGEGGSGGSDSLVRAFGGIGGIVANTYHLRDINRNGNYTIGGNASAEKAKSLPEHGDDYNQINYDLYSGGGGGGGGAPVSNINIFYNPPPTVEPGTCDDTSFLGDGDLGIGVIYLIGYSYNGSFYQTGPIDADFNFELLNNLPTFPGYNAIQIAFDSLNNQLIPLGCNVEIVDLPSTIVNSGSARYAIDWNGDGDTLDSIYSGGISEQFIANTVSNYNDWAQQLKNATNVNLTDTQIDKYVDNLCLNNIANGLSTCGGDGGRGGDGNIIIKF